MKNAIFKNNMGGSTSSCQFINSWYAGKNVNPVTVNNVNHKLTPHLTFKLPPSLPTTCIIAKGGRSASKTYIQPENIDIISDIHLYDGPFVVLPNNTNIAPSH